MWQLVYYIVVLALAYAMMPKPTEPKPATMSDIDLPTAEPGRPLPVVFGTVLLQDANVVWYGDLDYEAVKTKSGK